MMDGFMLSNAARAIDACNLKGPSVIHKSVLNDILKCLLNEKIYIVQSPCGDVLQIYRETIIPDNPDPEKEEIELYTCGFEICNVDFGGQKLVKLSGIGNHALFIGHNTSSLLPVKDYPKLLPNHIYITDDRLEWVFACKDVPRDVGIYILDSNSLSNGVYPEPWKSWLPPIWVMPNLAKTVFHDNS